MPLTDIVFDVSPGNESVEEVPTGTLNAPVDILTESQSKNDIPVNELILDINYAYIG